LQPARAEIICAAFEHRKIELHRFRQRAQNSRQHRQVFFRELFLQIDRVRRDDGLFPVRHGEQNRRDQVRQRFADARARLDREVLAVLQRPGHRHRHLLLLRAKLEILRLRQNTRRRKNFFNLRDQIGAGGLMFDG